MNKWDLRFLDLAKLVSAWSKDPSTQTGAVIVDTLNRIVSVGFNGLPRSVADAAGLLGDRERKLKTVIHAEINALLFAERHRLPGATIYLWPWPPCGVCASAIVQAAIFRCVACAPTQEQESRWQMEFGLMRRIFDEAGVRLETQGRE